MESQLCGELAHCGTVLLCAAAPRAEHPGSCCPVSSLAVAATGSGTEIQSSDASAPSGNTKGPAVDNIAAQHTLSSSQSTGHRKRYGPGGVAVDLESTSGTGTAQKEDPKVAQARLKRIKLRLHDGLHL